ncbi:MAG: DoxX family protein [Halolamina sp.]
MSAAIRWGVVAAVAASVVSGRAAAHVDYVTDGENTVGDVVRFLLETLTDPMNAALLAGGGVAAGVTIVGYLTFADLVPDVEVARRTLRSYGPYLPWMLRLSLGLPLVGAGFTGYLFSPAIAVEARFLQVGVGFLLLFGLATRAVAVVGVVAYSLTAIQYPLAFHASEYVAGFLAVAVMGPGQPSADMLIKRLAQTDGTVTGRLAEGVDLSWADPEGGRRAAAVILRVFVGLNFAYLGVSQKLLEPGRALQVVEKYDLTAVVPVAPELWVVGAGLTELAVGTLLVVGFLSRGVAAVAFMMMTLTLFGLPDDPVLAHVSLFGLASAIMVVGSGPYSVDEVLVPRLRRKLSARLRDDAGDVQESAT